MTINEIAKIYAKDTGITPRQARNHIINKAQPYLQWASDNPQYTVNGRGTSGMIDSAAAGDDVDAMLDDDWQLIKAIQQVINNTLSTGDGIG